MFGRRGKLSPADPETSGKAKASGPGERGVPAIPAKRESFYIISYDITVNRIRNKIAEELKNYGRRVQYSVFECELTDRRFRELYAKLADFLQQALQIEEKQEEKDEEEEKKSNDVK